MTEIQILIEGNVQGIGFRATTKRIAHSLNLSGTVRNLPNAGVEICIEGTEADAKKLIKLLKHEFAHYITSVSIKETSLKKPYSSFEITF